MLFWLGVGATAAWLTKPDIGTFRSFFDKWLRESLRKAEGGTGAGMVGLFRQLKTGLQAVVNGACASPKWTDYGLWVWVEVSVPQVKGSLAFLGVAGGWHPMCYIVP